MPNEFVARNGIIGLNNSQITGSLSISGSLIINGTSYIAATSGTSGTSGSAGSSGQTGAAGSSGSSGSAGSSGQTGAAGSSGSSGSAGSSGQTGAAGSSGSSGSAGSSGQTGAAGSSGSSGSAGSSGQTGAAGSSGSSGSAGSSGQTGAAGSSGSSGSAGSSGQTGAAGSSGSSGSAGSSGTSVSVSGVANYVTKFNTTTTIATGSIRDDGLSGTTNVFISSSGNVGIGTTTPNQKLEVAGIGRFTGTNAFSIGGDTGQNRVQYSTTGFSRFGLLNSGNGYTGLSAASVSIGSVYGDTAPPTSGIIVEGNVGIGTTSPDKKLRVSAGDIKISNNYKYIIGDTADADGITITSDGATNNMLIAQNNNAYIKITTSGASGDIRFFPNTVEQVTFKASGNVGIGTTSPNARLDVSGSTIITGSLTIITGSAIEFQVTNTGVKVGNVVTDTHTVTGSLGISGSTIIVGALTIGTSSLGSTENTLVVGPSPSGGTGEGGQILLQATGGSWTSASMLDNYQNRFRILRGTNASSDAEPFSLNLHNGQLTINKYTGSGAFTGTAAANLAVDSSGNVITVAAGGSSAPTAVTFNRVTGSYTFVLADAGKTIEMSGSTNTTYNLTVPPASTTNFADGTFIDVVLYGTGSIQFVTGSGVTFRSANSWAKLGTRYGAATIINISGDEWYLIGNLNA